MARLETGAAAPDFTLLDQHGEEVALGDQRGHRTLVYFYPKADTPGCTTQACGLRDVRDQLGDTAVIGISPDQPAKLAKFDDKYGLGFTLLSDPEHATAEDYGVWVEKSMYGRRYMGVERSAFLVEGDGTLAEVWYKISPKDTPTKLLAALSTS
jgi:peroxiredoxin Q/BCP